MLNELETFLIHSKIFANRQINNSTFTRDSLRFHKNSFKAEQTQKR